MGPLSESNIEQTAIEILKTLGYEYAPGPEISPGGERAERGSYSDVILEERLRRSIARINPDVPEEARDKALREVLRIASPDLLHNNEQFHKTLVESIPVQYHKDGEERSYLVWLVDFNTPGNNEFLAVNQFTIVEHNQQKRPDIILFVNGLPLVVIELKNPTDEDTTVESAFRQIKTYQEATPSLFTYNAICVASDGLDARAGTITSSRERFMAWKSSDGNKHASKLVPQIETLIVGMLAPATLLDLVRNFIVFEKTKKENADGLTQVVTEKKIAAYHQYYAVNKAIERTLSATDASGDKRGGVVWHTQGSGKSLSMVFYAGKLVQQLDNPTIVVLTDRNDLDDQLFDTFAACRTLLRQEPQQAEYRKDLKTLLRVASGGIVFTTIHKFLPEDGSPEHPLLSDRRNIVVIADEAHRTQYGFKAKYVTKVDPITKKPIETRLVYGLAKYMRDALPNATYIGFTGTPIEKDDANTKQVFGDYVDTYDIKRAVDDHATVTINYESRLAKVNLTEEGRKLIEEHDEEIENSEELTEREKAHAKWTKLEAIVGHPQRLKNLAKDIVTHFEARTSVLQGKGMIVCMSRRVASNLYYELVKLRPEWVSDDLHKGVLKVVMTGLSSDGPEMSRLHTTKDQRRTLGDRMKDPEDSLKLVIVRDMWLTGFDAPCLHTLYLDKPMHGHSLMQAIARVNRIFRDKTAGLVVDYLGIASDLKQALSFYTEAGGKGEPVEDLSHAIEAMMEKLELVRGFFAEESNATRDILAEDSKAYLDGATNFNYMRFFAASSREKLTIILEAEEHLLGIKDGKNRFVQQVTMLAQAFSISMPNERAVAVQEEVAFFEAVKARIVKFAATTSKESGRDYETTIKQIVDQALSSEEVIDIFDAAGIRKPEISILGDEFLQEIKGMKHKNLALELLKRILNDELRTQSKTNLVRSRKLLEMIEGVLKRYQNNLLTTAEVIRGTNRDC